jgi:hypothetical protein
VISYTVSSRDGESCFASTTCSGEYPSTGKSSPLSWCTSKVSKSRTNFCFREQSPGRKLVSNTFFRDRAALFRIRSLVLFRCIRGYIDLHFYHRYLFRSLRYRRLFRRLFISKRFVVFIIRSLALLQRIYGCQASFASTDDRPAVSGAKRGSTVFSSVTGSSSV